MLQPIKPPKIKLFLDSGAFGAWQRKIELPLEDYIAFIKRYQHLIHAYVAMDVIPGQPGRRSEVSSNMVGGRHYKSATIEDTAKKSYDNLCRMQDAGLQPIPVYHQDEDPKWLEKMIDNGCTYIGISPYLRSHKSSIKKFLDESFSIVCDSGGRPRVKTHGFGVTGPDFVGRVPWYSVDSTSWKMAAAYGSILVPTYVGGKPDFRRKPTVVGVTGGRDTTNQLEGWSTTHPLLYDCAIQFLDECGVTVTEVRNIYGARVYAVVKYFQGLEAACQDIVFEHRSGRMDSQRQWDARDPAPRWKPSFRMIYAAAMATGLSASLNECGIGNRLLSYFDLRNKPESYLENYVKTGLPGELKRGANQRWANVDPASYRHINLAHRAEATHEEN